MEEELVSIVVPVYNVENYLKRCLDSIIKQSYKNLDIILVNDGSTDSSSRICTDYAATDSRIRVIHKENSGLSDARNAGIDIATGRYITFIDSDDYISTEFIEQLYQAIKRENTEIAACGRHSTESEEACYLEDDKKSTAFEVWNSQEALRNILLQRKMTTSAWGKLYKSSLFRDIRYPSGKLYEDLATTYQLIGRSEKIVWIEKKMYYYFQRMGSIQNSKFDLRKLDELEIVYQMKEYIDKYWPALKTATTNRMISSCFHTLFLINDDEQYKDIAGNIKKVIISNRKGMVFGKDVNKKVRFGCLLTCLGFGLTGKVYRWTGMRGKINL